MTATPAWLAAVESSLNRRVGASLRAATLARRLEATALRVDVDGITSIRITVIGGRIGLASVQPLAGSDGADATIAGSPLALLRLARGGGSRRNSRPFSRAGAPAAVAGDAEIANSYRQLLTAAGPDWEEELSRLIGDVPARYLSRFALQALSWARGARRTAFANLSEYLQEESRDLVSGAELEEFLRNVDGMRETADRIEARILRLERRLREPG